VSEIGKPLKVSELREKTVVVIAPPGRKDVAITMWVESISPGHVTFYSGAMNWHVRNFVRGDTLVDDQERTVEVFEYLGT
jgi:hypothetical protein